MTKTRGIIGGSLIITLIIGVLNNIYKHDKLPSMRFFFGTGVLYLFLEGLAEFEDEIAKALALAIVTFTLLGEGGGVLDHFMGGGASKDTLNTDPRAGISHSSPQDHHVNTSIVQRRSTPAQMTQRPVKPILPLTTATGGS